MEEEPGESVLEARYTNVFQVGFNVVEFVLEFGQSLPDGRDRFQVRVITSPVHVRELLRLLETSVADFEREFGPIPSVER